MELISLLVDEDKKDYKCYSELKRLLDENEKFKQTLILGIKEGKIRGFDKELWQKIRLQNIRKINSFEDVFIEGANIGYCTVASKQLSYSLNGCYLCGGILPILRGTKNCEDGSHTWILHNNEIMDTTLMLVIDLSYIEKIGYIEENRYNPNVDPIYLAAKTFTNDYSPINKKRGESTENHNIYSIEGVKYIVNNIERLKQEENNLMINELGHNIVIKNEFGDYIYCNKSTYDVKLIIKNLPYTIDFDFRSYPEVYKMDGKIISFDDLYSILSQINGEIKNNNQKKI